MDLTTARRQYFSKNYEPNTIIGGIGAYINTKQDLLSKLSVGTNVVRNFRKVNDDIHFFATTNWLIRANTFNGDDFITSLIDEDGLITAVGQNGLRFNPNLLNVKLDNAGLGNSSLSFNDNCYNLDYGGHLTIRSLGSLGSLSGSKFKSIHIKENTVLPSNSVRDTTELEIITTDEPLVELAGDCLYNSSIKTLNVEYVTSLSVRCFSNSGIVELNFYSLLTVPSIQFIQNCSFLKYLRMPLVEVIPGAINYFSGLTSCELIDMRMCKTYGTSASGGTVAQYGFNGLKLNCTIRVHEALLTANAGSPHEAFLWVKANRSAIVEFYDDNGNYVSTL